jgi:hypothetical protein
MWLAILALVALGIAVRPTPSATALLERLRVTAVPPAAAGGVSENDMLLLHAGVDVEDCSADLEDAGDAEDSGDDDEE